MKNTVKTFLPLDRYPKTRIMATIGKANYQPEKLAKMLDEGATVFRLNAAHITADGFFDFKDSHVAVRSVLNDIRYVSEERRQPIVLFFDLAGPKVRVHKLLSFHSGWLTSSEMPNRPHIGETVFLYSTGVSWNDRNIKGTLGSANPNHNYDFSGQTSKEKVKEAASRAVSKDGSWRLVLDIRSFKTVAEGLTLKDGKCALSIIKKINDHCIEARVTDVADDFLFVERQGVNPKRYIFPEIITEKDIADLHFALDNEIDFISLSFACSPLEAFQLRREIQEYCKSPGRNLPEPRLFAKFESIFSVLPKEAERFAEERKLLDEKVIVNSVAPEQQHRYRQLIRLYRKNPIEAICDAFDGAMIARGDLAVEAYKYDVPFYQTDIIHACRLRHKPVIVATEVLQSMKSGNPSTRAEIGDISTAVREEADVIMLAGEVADTKSPPENVVRELRTAIEASEQKRLAFDDAKDLHKLLSDSELSMERGPDLDQTKVKIGMGNEVCVAARARKADVILASASTGETVQYISYFRPSQKIIAIVWNPRTAKKLILTRGVYPVVMRFPPKHDLNDFGEIANEIHEEMQITSSGKNTKSFVVPSLLRIDPRTGSKKNESKKKDGMPPVPNTIHEFSLPRKSKSLPERERKYILAREHYQRLAAYLQAEASEPIEKIQQENIYYDDNDKIISRQHGMIRIRKEKRNDGVRALFTVKGRSKRVGDVTEERDETEFEIPDTEKIKRREIKIGDLPLYYRKFLWAKYQKAFEGAGVNADALQLREIGRMTNTRLVASVSCGLVLELDEFETAQNRYFELEIETRKADEAIRDEYIHLLFASLNIPLVSLSNYPSKYVWTMVDSGVLPADKKWISARAKALRLLNEPHSSSCSICGRRPSQSGPKSRNGSRGAS